MTTIGSMCEEKLSPIKPTTNDELRENGSAEEDRKLIFEADDKYNDSPKEATTNDDVLDEIESKINKLNLIDGYNKHGKCMDTVRSQGETINTLIHQLRLMFDEYTFVNNEREYYEELNEALFRCLELRIGNTLFDEDMVGENSSDCSKNNMETSAGTQTDDDPRAERQIHVQASENSGSTTATEPTDSDPVTADINENTPEPKKTTKMSKIELKNINNVLLREVFELRHQMDVLKECFRDYLNSDDHTHDQNMDPHQDAAQMDDHTWLRNNEEREDDKNGAGI